MVVNPVNGKVIVDIRFIGIIYLSVKFHNPYLLANQGEQERAATKIYGHFCENVGRICPDAGQGAFTHGGFHL